MRGKKVMSGLMREMDRGSRDPSLMCIVGAYELTEICRGGPHLKNTVKQRWNNALLVKSKAKIQRYNSCLRQ